MKISKAVIGIGTAVLLAAGSLAAMALGQDTATPALAQGAATATPAAAQDNGATPTVDIAAQRHQKLVGEAGELGLNIAGMSDDQIMAAIEAKDSNIKQEQSCTDTPGNLHQKLVTGAGEMGININGLSDDQILTAIKAAQAAAPDGAKPTATADTGAAPTPDISALRHQKLVKGAADLDIDINGMSDEQIMAAITAKDPAVQPEQSCSATPQQQHQKLVATAQELGIAVTGMSDEQILAAIKAKAPTAVDGGQK